MNRDIILSGMFPWQRELFHQFSAAIEDGKRLLMVTTGRRSGKSDFLTRFALLWRRGVLFGGSIAFCGPSEEHVAGPRDWVRTWMADSITGPNPQGDGYSFGTGGTMAFVSLAPGKVAALRGRELNLVIIDEAAYLKRNLLNLLEANIMPTLSLSEGPVLLASTPKGVGNDYHTLWNRAGQEGKRFGGMSLLNPNFTQREWDYRRKRMPSLIFAQEYKGEFVNLAGALLKPDQIRHGVPPPLEEFETVVFGLDLALETKESNDYSALCVTGLHEGRIWVLFGRRWRLKWEETVQLLKQYHDAWQPALAFIESVAFGQVAVRDLVKAGLELHALKITKAKELRFLSMQTLYALGMVWHAETLDQECEQEVLSFPEGEHDDFSDALTYGVGGLFRDIRASWNSDETWGWLQNVLPHEQHRKALLYADLPLPELPDVAAPLPPEVEQAVARRKAKAAAEQEARVRAPKLLPPIEHTTGLAIGTGVWVRLEDGFVRAQFRAWDSTHQYCVIVVQEGPLTDQQLSFPRQQITLADPSSLAEAQEEATPEQDLA